MGTPYFKKSSFFAKRNKQLKQYFQANWLNVIVLCIALGASAAASGVSYTYANDSVSFLNEITIMGSVFDVLY